MTSKYGGQVINWELFKTHKKKDKKKVKIIALTHWLGAYRTNALYSGHIFVRFNDLEDVFT